jgi:hypothetical protein
MRRFLFYKSVTGLCEEIASPQGVGAHLAMTYTIPASFLKTIVNMILFTGEHK